MTPARTTAEQMQERAEAERYNPGPDPDDSSFQAFCNESECRYDVMPHWWWDSDRRQAVYLQWQRRKEDEVEAKADPHARAERATVLNAKRVFKIIGEVADGTGKGDG